MSHVWQKTIIESSTIIENAEECVLDCHIKKLTLAVVQSIASNLAPFVMHVCMASYMMADYGHANHTFRVNVRS